MRAGYCSDAVIVLRFVLGVDGEDNMTSLHYPTNLHNRKHLYKWVLWT